MSLPLSSISFDRAQDSIVARLVEAVQTGPSAWARIVGTRKTLAEVAEDQQVVPGVYVVYDGLMVYEANEFQAALAHRWVVVIAVSNAAKAIQGAAPLHGDVGPMIWDVLGALHGFTPVGAASGMVPLTPPRPHYPADSKFGYFPLAFACNIQHNCRRGPMPGRPGNP